MANWKKVIVSGSVAELAKVSASLGINIPTASLNNSTTEDFILTVGSQGSVQKRDPNTIGAAFQSMSIAGTTGLGDFGTDTFIAASGLNELVFVSGSNVTLETSHSSADDHSETVGYIKINAATSSVAATENQTTVSSPVGSVYTVGTVQDINTGSNVAFGSVSASGDITAANLNIAGDIVHIGDTDTKIQFNDDAINFNTAGSECVRITNTGKVGIGNNAPVEALTVQGSISASGNISASGDLNIAGNAAIDGDLGLGGNIFGLTGFAVTIDEAAVTTGATNFGSGSNAATTNHKFTGSVSITGSGITLVDGVFAGDGNSLTNLDADNLVDTKDLTWGNSLTQSVGEGSVYNVTTSIQLNVNLSGSDIATGAGGIYIPGNTIRIDQLATGTEGTIISYSGSNGIPYVISKGSAGQVLTANGTTASFQDLPPTTALGIQTGSVSNDVGNGVALVLTSSAATNNIVTKIPVSGSDNQISVSGSARDNTIHLRLADNISGISTITASAGIKTGYIQSTGDITASGNLTIGGNFTVNGTTTLINTSNLLVEDAFLVLSSGSTSNDGGFIVQDAATTGKGFGYDTTIGRWGLQTALAHDASNISPTEWIMSVKLDNANPGASSSPTYGQSGDKASSGQVWINTGSDAQGGGDIWIYVD